MPRFLSNLHLREVSILLREFHMKHDVIKKFFSFPDLLLTFSKKIQHARYEQLIIKLATAYDGYRFYLPAFLDFRGRIYRSGILHFHERDLARSLILFADDTKSDIDMNQYINMNQYFVASAFHYKPFSSYEEALDWALKNIMINVKDEIAYARTAKRPFQLLSSINTRKQYCTPITQDASASAYQIMSIFLLDESMAKRTNLIPDPSSKGSIKDVYSFMLDELKEFILSHSKLHNDLSKVVCDNLDRKIAKSLFMPIIYGKTLMSTASDLKEHLSHYITHKECFEVASVCFQFWKTKYDGLESLIQLIRNISWFVSATDSPVNYSIPYFTTEQNYMQMDKINIWVYDGQHKKRRRVTLRVSSSNRDHRKTEISTFVNFIHQRDAYIAMRVVEQMANRNIPIYTVHDNFLTTIEHSNILPEIYNNVITEMDPPLKIVNEFIYLNVIKPALSLSNKGHPAVKRKGKGQSIICTVIPSDELHKYLLSLVP